MKTNKETEKPNKDLSADLQGKRKELRSLRFNLAARKLKNVREIKKVKKNIAQILTVINQSLSKEK